MCASPSDVNDAEPRLSFLESRAETIAKRARAETLTKQARAELRL